MADIDMTKVEELVEQSKQEWIKQNLSDLPARVDKALDGHFDGLIARLLGMDNRWARREWELDHCNGRQGNSFLGVEIKEQIEQIVGPLVVSLVKDVKLTDKQTKAIQDEYRTQLGREVMNAAHKFAAEEAYRIVEQVVSGEYEPAPESAPKPKRPAVDIFQHEDDDYYDEENDE